MNKTYTPEQMAVLAKYEDYLRTAARSDWARYPGLKALEEIHAVDDEALGKSTRLYSACGNCVLNLLRSVGKRYSAQKEAEEEQETAQTSTQTPKMGKGSTEKKPARKPKK